MLLVRSLAHQAYGRLAGLKAIYLSAGECGR